MFLLYSTGSMKIEQWAANIAPKLFCESLNHRKALAEWIFFCIAGGLTIHCRFPSFAPHTVWLIVYGMDEDHVQLELKKNWFHCKFLLSFGLWKFGWKPSIIHELQGQKLVGTKCWMLMGLNVVLVEWNRRYKMQSLKTNAFVRNSMEHVL